MLRFPVWWMLRLITNEYPLLTSGKPSFWLYMVITASFCTVTMSRMMSVVYHDVEGHTMKIISLLDKARAIDA